MTTAKAAIVEKKKGFWFWVAAVVVFLILFALLGWQCYEEKHAQSIRAENTSKDVALVEKQTTDARIVDLEKKNTTLSQSLLLCEKKNAPVSVIPHARPARTNQHHHQNQALVAEKQIPSAVVIEKIPSAVVVERDPSVIRQEEERSEGLLDGVDANFIERKSEEPVDVVVPKRRRVVIVESQQYYTAPQGTYYSQPYSYEYGRSSYQSHSPHEHHRSERVSPPSRTPSSTPAVQDSGGPINPAP